MVMAKQNNTLPNNNDTAAHSILNKNIRNVRCVVFLTTVPKSQFLAIDVMKKEKKRK